jgi:coenzyme F430 synthetase
VHSSAGLQACSGSHSSVAVLDTIHGAATIAERLVKLGINAEAFEVYHHFPHMEKFDLVVSPVHLPPTNSALAEARRLGKAVIAHHQAVGEILHPSMPVVEITGMRGKTTSALLLSMILSYQKKIVSHTTRGIELWSCGRSQVLQSGLSIAPANVIKAVDAAEQACADALVCEISLGGTGLADFGVLTTFQGDYRIAGGTAWASDAKLQMCSLAKPGSKLIAGKDTKLDADLTFGPGGNIWSEPDCIWFGEERIPLELGGSLDTGSYLQAISAASASAFALGLKPEEIASGLKGFEGFSGRMKVIKHGDMTIYDNSNSGLKVSGVERALDMAPVGAALVVGEESEAVCEGMDISTLIELLRRRRCDVGPLVLVGERLEPYAAELKAKATPDLASGLELARVECRKTLISCVKCFR